MKKFGFEGTGYAAIEHQGQVYLGTNNGLFIQKNNNEGHPNLSYELVPGSEGLVNGISVVNDQLILNHHRGAFVVNGEGANTNS